MFVGAGAAIWVAGIQLSDQTDVLTMRLGLGSALGGLILLAIATNLPEIAIVAAAAVSGNIGVAVGNILGGIAIQTVVLVALDAFGVRGSKPLTYRAASLVLVLEAALVVALLAIVIGGTQLPATLITARLTPAPVLILIVWVLGLVLVQRAERSLPWHDSGQPPDSQQQPRGHRTAMTEQQATAQGTSTARAAVSFGFAGAVTLIAGVVLERSGEAIADHIGLSGVLFGATVLAAATSLPELSTGLRSVRHGDYQLAVSDLWRECLPASAFRAGNAAFGAGRIAGRTAHRHLSHGAGNRVDTDLRSGSAVSAPPPHRPAGGRFAGCRHPVRPGHGRTIHRLEHVVTVPIRSASAPSWNSARFITTRGSVLHRPLTRVRYAGG
jgi:cation:H+ antiporter